jgi:hypothetical protein
VVSGGDRKACSVAILYLYSRWRTQVEVSEVEQMRATGSARLLSVSVEIVEARRASIGQLNRQ